MSKLRVMSNQGQGLHSHFIKDLYVVCLYKANVLGERLQDLWSSGIMYYPYKKEIMSIFSF